MPRFLLIPSAAVWRFAGFVAVITFIFPAANIVMLKAFGTIRSLEMEKRKDRLLPFMMITVFYGVVCAMFYYKVSMNVNFNKIMLIATVLTAVATVVTFFFKISIHSLAMGGALGIIMPLNKAAEGTLLYPVVLLIILAGVVMSARLYLQAHTLREVGYGVAVGFLVGFFGMIILF
jgi:membrane-associated phospholipid phosphatase